LQEKVTNEEDAIPFGEEKTGGKRREWRFGLLIVKVIAKSGAIIASLT